MKRVVAIALALATAMLGADITGKWKGTAETPNGTVERSFDFKQDGTKLTGETSSEFTGKSTIENGKVDGEAVTFTIKANFGGNEMTLNYTGKLANDEIAFDVELPVADAPQIKYVAKRVK